MLVSSFQQTGEAGRGEIEICAAERLHAISETEPEPEEDGVVASGRLIGLSTTSTSCYTSEIVEEQAPELTPSAFPGESNDVYVAVGRKNSSLDALQWALTEIVIPGRTVFLVHIFPPVTAIPTPLGMISRNQVAPAQVEAFMREEENKREALIHKYINLCNLYEVRAETVLVESNMVAETIVQLLEIGMIKRLVMGTRRSRLRRRGNGKAEYVQKNAPKDCEIKTICDGKEVVANADQTPISPVTSSPPPPAHPATTSKEEDDEDEPQEERNKKQSEHCKCFPSLI